MEGQTIGEMGGYCLRSPGSCDNQRALSALGHFRDYLTQLNTRTHFYCFVGARFRLIPVRFKYFHAVPPTMNHWRIIDMIPAATNVAGL
jgi:hypothetical protein